MPYPCFYIRIHAFTFALCEALTYIRTCMHTYIQVAPIFSTANATIDLSDRHNRTWLLPVLRKHVRSASLAFFTETLLPVADAMHKQAIAADSAKRPVEAKNLMMVHEQVLCVFVFRYVHI